MIQTTETQFVPCAFLFHQMLALLPNARAIRPRPSLQRDSNRRLILPTGVVLYTVPSAVHSRSAVLCVRAII